MKTKIDKFFNENYAQLVDVTKSYIRDLGKNLEAEGLVSDAYIYVSQKKGITESEIGRLTVGFIYRELYLWNSKTNRKGLLYSIEESTDEEIYDQSYSAYLPICSHIKKLIRQDQIEGGMVGQYNPSITQRLNGLTEKTDVTTGGDKINEIKVTIVGNTNDKES
jgi:hypothetical protein